MVHRLAGRTVDDMRPTRPPADAAEAARTLAGLLDRLSRRATDHLARFALTVDLVDDPELHAYLTAKSPIRAGALAAATATLDELGVPEPARHAPGLVTLMDGLLFDRVAGTGRDPASRPDAESLIAAYLRGLVE
jgi:hypothetical protein